MNSKQRRQILFKEPVIQTLSKLLQTESFLKAFTLNILQEYFKPDTDYVKLSIELQKDLLLIMLDLLVNTQGWVRNAVQALVVLTSSFNLDNTVEMYEDSGFQHKITSLLE